MAWLNIRANEIYGKGYDALTSSEQAGLRQALKEEYRTSANDGTQIVVLSDTRIKAIHEVAPYYIELYGDNPEYVKTRENFAMKNNTLPDLTAREHLTNFYFWTAWIASTNRPGTDATFTNNWPHEPLIDNVPTAENFIWSVASVVFLIAGVGFLILTWAFSKKEEEIKLAVPESDPLTKINLTPSQKALGKYGLLVVALFVLQVFLGGFVAHYTVEGHAFYGIAVADWLPYALVRTWHI